ncbi:MAG TPA: phage tail tape measure protein, partial [Candidatus Ozemobacteraceae bacterium]|nr:phage tail tape measure protein [Candidatus Ozemobacteraceae bacterium]
MSAEELSFRATLDGSGFASGAQQLTGHLNTLGVQTNSATANLGGLGTILGTMANPATAAALGITAIGGAIASSVSVAGDFQQKMAGVNAIVGGSAADMQTLSNAAREAGASTSFSASQAADALGYMAGAGWNVQQSTAALKDTLTLASAGGMDLAQAGDLMTNTVSQFGLAATDSGRVANVLAAGASATNTSVSELGAGLGQVSHVAAARHGRGM